MSTTKVRSNDASGIASVDNIDMKFEIVVIPVSDVDRAKEFYGRLGWRLDADFDTGNDFRVIQFTPPGSGCSVIFGKNVTAGGARLGPGPLPDRLRHRGRPRRAARVAASRSARCSTTLAACTLARTSPTCLGGSGSAVRIPSIAATARSPRSAIRTATAGCSRRSRRGCRSDRPRDDDLRFGERSGERASACRGRPRRAREAHRRRRRELARLVRRIHGARAGRRRTAFVSDHDVIVSGTSDRTTPGCDPGRADYRVACRAATPMATARHAEAKRVLRDGDVFAARLL